MIDLILEFGYKYKIPSKTPSFLKCVFCCHWNRWDWHDIPESRHQTGLWKTPTRWPLPSEWPPSRCWTVCIGEIVTNIFLNWRTFFFLNNRLTFQIRAFFKNTNTHCIIRFPLDSPQCLIDHFWHLNQCQALYAVDFLPHFGTILDWQSQ